MIFKNDRFVPTAVAATVAATLLSSSLASAAGFEKTILWSGHWAPLGGAAAGAVTGAESLYFNPAGIVGGKGIELTGNFTPIFGKFEGPLPLPTSANRESKRSFSPGFGAFASFTPSEKWGVALGVYAGGGTKAIFEDVPFSATTAGTIQSNLSIVEYSLGGAYEIVDGLRLGAAYRVVSVAADVTAVGLVGGTTALPYNITGLSGTRWNGFRLGAQYAPRDAGWGIGATWRNQVDFTATTDDSLTSPASAAAPAIAGASVTSTFPMAFDLGGFFTVAEKQRMYLQYSFQEYHKAESLANTGGTAAARLLNTSLGFKNVNIGRIGYECGVMENWAFRLGYALTSPATQNGQAAANLSTPGFGHSIVLGTGTNVLGLVDLNGGVEYSWAKGTGEGATPGEFSSNNYSLHLGATYRM